MNISACCRDISPRLLPMETFLKQYFTINKNFGWTQIEEKSLTKLNWHEVIDLQAIYTKICQVKSSSYILGFKLFWRKVDNPLWWKNAIFELIYKIGMQVFFVVADKEMIDFYKFKFTIWRYRRILLLTSDSFQTCEWTSIYDLIHSNFPS